MKQIIFFVTVSLLTVAPAQAEEVDGHVQQSRQAVKMFFGKLKGQLQSAMKAGGPVKAIEVCSKQAPQIAKEVSQKTGLQIARTSLKTRNPGNVPDQWEKAVLEEFEARKVKGEHPEQMEKAEILEQNGKQVFRYMKAIPTGELCLKCHGSNIEPAVTAKLDKLYPDDKARGFKKGDIRGAFTIIKNL